MGSSESTNPKARAGIARSYTVVEDIVYLGLGLLLAAIVVIMLVSTFVKFGRSAVGWTLVANITGLLDQILLILLLVELLYTVQVSFREHALVPEPFLLVGLISVIRRVLVLTAVMGEKNENNAQPAQPLVPELAVLAGLILVLSISLVLLRRRNGSTSASRA
ncbi:MAG: hypothetical protein JWM53_4810 [bacterium]|nr:hypothetical protein [bacterium]